MSVYVRKSLRRGLTGPFIPCFDIANIEVDPEFRGMGIFTKWLDILEEHLEMPIYIECVLEERLIPFLGVRGYQMVGSFEGAPSFLLDKD